MAQPDVYVSVYVYVCVCFVFYELRHWYDKGFNDLDIDKILGLRGDSNLQLSTHRDDPLTD